LFPVKTLKLGINDLELMIVVVIAKGITKDDSYMLRVLEREPW